ncbi:putative thermonuclease [Candidatus Vecturithrix granuli]|uniref:Putative thermonuclease n=1 Tax=Vecturithrix granuli TaxID=1499967 RepID=A0A081BZ19_VECG1|nr:putative thermonuclease [Candidatus Vecturithrix granuli]
MTHITRRRNAPNVKKEICRVRSVYDGDTLTVEWAKSSWLGFKTEVRPVKVRLAYIDTPEIRYKQAGALQARELLEKLVQGKHVIVEYEQLPSGGGRRDDYNRMLAVVHLQRTFLPNVNINQLLLKKGLARLYHKPDNITPHHLKKLIRAERHAKRRRLGIWRMTRDQQSVSSSDIVLYIVLGIIVGIVIGLALS